MDFWKGDWVRGQSGCVSKKNATLELFAPQPDGALNKAARMKIRHYRQIYSDRSDHIVFLSITVNTSGRVYEDFPRLIFLHTHREASILARESPEESEQFRFLWASHLFLDLCNTSHYSHRFVYETFHTFTSFFELSSSVSSS